MYIYFYLSGSYCVVLTVNTISYLFRFGYPDETYLQRVGGELEAKGVTIKDVDKNVLKELENYHIRKIIRN